MILNFIKELQFKIYEKIYKNNDEEFIANDNNVFNSKEINFLKIFENKSFNII